MDKLRYVMGNLGYNIVKELGKVIAECGGTLDAPTANIAIQVYAVDGFDNEPDWENETPPIDSAGVLIARPDIMQLLYNLPPDQLYWFLRADSAEMFFRRYVPGGDGMPSLRKRYHDNREALQRDYIELANKAAKL